MEKKYKKDNIYMRIFNLFNKEKYNNNLVFDEFIEALKRTKGFDTIIENHPTVRLITNSIKNTIALLPLNLYIRNKGGGASRASFNPLYDMVRDNPNPYETPLLFYSRLIEDMLSINGNAYLKIVKSEIDNSILGLMRLNPREVKIIVSNNTVTYTYKDNVYAFDEIIHLPSPYGTKENLYGVSPLEYCRDSIVSSSAMREYLKTYYENFISSKLHLKVDGSLEKFNLIKDELSRDFIDNAGKVFITPKEWEVSPINLQTNQTQEITENRNYQDIEIARAFNYPIDLLNPKRDKEDAETFYATFRETTLLPITTLIEEKFKQLLPKEDRGIFYFEYDYNNLLRPSITSRFQNYATAIDRGILTLNEVRKMENLSPYSTEIGDVPFLNVAYYQLTEENLKAAFAKSKLALQDLHNPQGDDKS